MTETANNEGAVSTATSCNVEIGIASVKDGKAVSRVAYLTGWLRDNTIRVYKSYVLCLDEEIDLTHNFTHSGMQSVMAEIPSRSETWGKPVAIMVVRDEDHGNVLMNVQDESGDPVTITGNLDILDKFPGSRRLVRAFGVRLTSMKAFMDQGSGGGNTGDKAEEGGVPSPKCDVQGYSLDEINKALGEAGLSCFTALVKNGRLRLAYLR